jgi:hypothetical protein
MTTMRTAVTTLVVAGAVLAGGGAAALADDGHGQNGSAKRQERCLQMAQKAAERQGLTVAQLEAKLRQHALDRIDAAAKAGKLTADQAAALKQRVNGWKLCDGKALRGVGKVARARVAHAGMAVASMMAGALKYLDLTPAELRKELKAGKSLGDLATAAKLSVGGLKTAMLAGITTRLDKAVTDKKLTAAQRDALLARYGKLADRLIEKSFGHGSG